MINFLKNPIGIFSGLLFKLVNLVVFLLVTFIFSVIVCGLLVALTGVPTNEIIEFISSALDVLGKKISDFFS